MRASRSFSLSCIAGINEPGLIASGFLNPQFELFRSVRSGSGSDRVSAHQMSKVRTESPVRHCSRDGVAIHAGRGFKNLSALLSRIS